jgi:hypothetical protein
VEVFFREVVYSWYMTPRLVAMVTSNSLNWIAFVNPIFPDNKPAMALEWVVVKQRRGFRSLCFNWRKTITESPTKSGKFSNDLLHTVNSIHLSVCILSLFLGVLLLRLWTNSFFFLAVCSENQIYISSRLAMHCPTRELTAWLRVLTSSNPAQLC